MASGAGDAVAHRRRDLRSGFLLISFFSVNLPKNPNPSSTFVFFFSDRHLWNGEREQCFIISLNQTSSINLSLNRAKEFRPQTNNILGQTPEQYFNDTSNDSRSGRRRCTEHGDDFLWTTFFPTGTGAAKASWISAETLVDLPSKTCTPEMCPSKISPPSPASRHATTISSPDKAKLGFPLEGLAIKTGPSTSSRPKPIIYAPIIKETKPRSVKSPLFLLSISNQCLGRLLFLKCRRHHLRQNTPALLLAFNHSLRTLGLVSNMAMSFDSKSLKIYDLSFPNQYCRRYEYGQISVTNFPNQKEVSASAEEDWKKAQVDSKKILAQPHQSTTSNPSRQGAHPEFNSTSDREVKTMSSFVQNTREPIICADYIVLFLGFDIKEEGSNIRAINMEEPPKELQGLFDDIQWILNLLSSISISFAYVSRKENSIADVLASTAVRSMTIGSLVFTSNGVYVY